MPSFSQKSKQILLSCHHDLQIICLEALGAGMDFTILEGHRSNEKQEELFRAGKSKLQAGESKHNRFPSHAVDIAPYPIDWNDKQRFVMLAGMMLGIARCKGIKLRWGGDWDGDFDLKDQTFNDLVHFELIEC